MLPTRRALLVLGCVAPLGLFGFLMSGALDIVLTIDAAVILLVAIDARLAVDPRVLHVTREAPSNLSVGRPIDYTYRWENQAGRHARLLLREVRPELLGGGVQPRNLQIGAHGMILDPATATPARRGRESAGWFAVRSRGPLGLGQRQRRLLAPWTVTVYPSLPISRLKASIADAARRPEAGLRQARRLGEGSQFESLREWVPGDDTRHIDWKATARRRKVIARQFEEERRQHVLLVLDAGRLLTAEVGGESRMEHAVRAALWLTLAAYHHGDNVGIMVVADEIMHYVAPQSGKRGLRQVLDVLAEVQPRLVEPDYPAAFRYLAIRNRKRALTVFFTDVIDKMASEVLLIHLGSLRPRHLPLVVTLRDPELELVADSRPSTEGDAYRKAAAEEVLSARDEALVQMRRSGAMVLDVSPDRAGAAAVEKYLELKRKGRL